MLQSQQAEGEGRGTVREREGRSAPLQKKKKKKKEPYCFEVQPSHLISVAGHRGDCERLTAEALPRSCSIKGRPRGEVQL